MRALAYITFVLFGIALLLFIFKPAPSLGKLWFDMHAGSLNFVQVIVQRYISPDLWNRLLLPLLKQPPWFGFTILAGFSAVPYFMLMLAQNSSGSRRKQ